VAWTRHQMAARAAQELREALCQPRNRHPHFGRELHSRGNDGGVQSETDCSYGAVPREHEVDADLITQERDGDMVAGAAIFSSADPLHDSRGHIDWRFSAPCRSPSAATWLTDGSGKRIKGRVGRWILSLRTTGHRADGAHGSGRQPQTAAPLHPAADRRGRGPARHHICAFGYYARRFRMNELAPGATREQVKQQTRRLYVSMRHYLVIS